VSKPPIIIGRIGAPHGVQGWVRIISHTEIAQDIFDFDYWMIALPKAETDPTLGPLYQVTLADIPYKAQTNKLIALLPDCKNREHAAKLTNRVIMIEHQQLPLLDEGYYWTDLVGLEVYNLEAVYLGKIIEVFNTGANDILAVKKSDAKHRCLIPFVEDHVVKEVDLTHNRLTVDWDSEIP